MNLKTLLLIFTTLYASWSLADDKQLIRLGVMASGTLAWELAAMVNAGLPVNSAYTLETVTLANQQAGKIALQSGSVDVIVSDWIWVTSARAEGADLTFYPFSNSSGGLVVPADSPIKTLADLKGKKIGVAGGELDKNWLLLQALGLKQGIDLNKTTEKFYGAPPLLNQQFIDKRIDVLLTYWQFAARLEAEGNRQLLSGEDIIRELGVKESVANLGYVFKAGWGNQHKEALKAFFKNAQQVRQTLCQSEQAWEKITPLTEVTGENARKLLRSRYCQGRVENWHEANRQAAEEIYQYLRQLGDSKLNLNTPHIPAGVFWSLD